MHSSRWQVSNQPVFYITGRGGSHEKGLGAFLSERYQLLRGLNLSHTWLRQPHKAQVTLVLECLKEAEDVGAPVIANSYGGYLVLLSIFARPSVRTSVLLLSPILGKTVINGTYYRPAGGKSFADALRRLIEKPKWIELYMGEADPGYVPDTWDSLLTALKPDQHALFSGVGHEVPKQLVTEVVGQFVRGHRSRLSVEGASHAKS